MPLMFDLTCLIFERGIDRFFRCEDCYLDVPVNPCFGCRFPNLKQNRKELRVEYAQSNTTIITSIINIIGINNYMFRPYMWAITRL